VTRLRPARTDLVFSSVGDRSVHPMWVAGRRRHFDLSLYDYAGPSDRYRPGTVHHVARAGTKFENFVHFQRTATDLLSRYRHVLVLDDDIEMDSRSIDRLFAIMASRGLWLAQPAYTPDSHVRWPITVAVPGLLLRYTDFVEVGVTAFAVPLLPRVMDAIAGSRSGWGLDMVYSQLLGDPPDRIAIVDSVTCRHPRRTESEMDAVMTRPEMQAEGRDLLARYRDGQWLQPTVYSSVPLARFGRGR